MNGDTPTHWPTTRLNKQPLFVLNVKQAALLLCSLSCRSRICVELSQVVRAAKREVHRSLNLQNIWTGLQTYSRHLEAPAPSHRY